VVTTASADVTLWLAAQGQRAVRAASGSRSSFLPPLLTESRLSCAGRHLVRPHRLRN
jgi:hypothetical protein